MGGGSMDEYSSTPESPRSLVSLPTEFDLAPSASSFISVEDDDDDCGFEDLMSSSSLMDKRLSMDYRKLVDGYSVDREQEEESLGIKKFMLKNYTPGSFIEEVGGLKKEDYMIPEMTTLLLIGPSGSGKSSLVNKITRVVEDNEFLPDRAQETYDSCQGTCFLQEYMVPRSSNTSFCLYDSRSISETADSHIMVNSWMMDGVHHGQMAIRDDDDAKMKASLILKAWQVQDCAISNKREVNFVIFVVDAISVLKSMQGEDNGRYMKLIEESFKLPCLSFKDAKPAVVITHGDILSISDRAHVRMCLGQLFGVPPEKQIFDIPDIYDPQTKLAVMSLLIYSLQQADRSLQLKEKRCPKQNITTKSKSAEFCWRSRIYWVLHGLLILLLLLMIGYNLWVSFNTYKRLNGTAKKTENKSMICEWFTSYEKVAISTWQSVEKAIAHRFGKNVAAEKVRWADIRHLWMDV